MHLLVSSSLTSLLTDPFHSTLSFVFLPIHQTVSSSPTDYHTSFLPPSSALFTSLSFPVSLCCFPTWPPPTPFSIFLSFFFQPCTSLSLLSSSAALRIVFLLLYCCFFHWFSIRISFSTGFSNFFPPVRAACTASLL